MKLINKIGLVLLVILALVVMLNLLLPDGFPGLKAKNETSQTPGQTDGSSVKAGDNTTVSPQTTTPAASSTPPPTTTAPATTPAPATTEAPKADPVITVNPVEINPGDFFTVFIKDAEPTDKITFDTKLMTEKIETITYNDGLLALIPVSYFTNPGDFTINIKVLRGDKAVADKTENITLLNKKFPASYVNVTEEQAATRTDEKVLASDGEHTSKARANSSPVPLWTDNFIMPLEGRMGAEFGFIRYVNNVVIGRHSGLDICIGAGVPIKASNSGKVVLAMELILTGNTVIIDHGMDIFTAYSHCSKLLVSTGDMVERGDVIAEVGSTGFSTGDHLHWTVTIGSTFVDPWLFVDKNPLELIKFD